MHLLSQVWIYLLLALILGFLIGWFIFKSCVHQGLVTQLDDRTERLVRARATADNLEVAANQFERDWRSTAETLEERDLQLAQTLQHLTATRADLQESNRDRTDTLDQLEARTGELRVGQSEIAELSRALRDLEAEYEATRLELGTCRSEVREAQTRIAERTNKYAEAENEAIRVRGELDSQKDRILDLTKEIDALNAALRART